ncbi:MAG: hypothetical protein LBK67_12770, partial [Coriobacteriales bacterium]|nr:hypothetical protein [Coriobacteriales bacterium]
MSTTSSNNTSRKDNAKPKPVEPTLDLPQSSTSPKIDWTPEQNTVETSPEPSETPPDELEAVPNAGVAAEESPNRYIIVQPPDDLEDSGEDDDVPVFAILLLIVLAVAVAVACFHIMKKAAKAKTDRCPPINQSTSKIKQDYHASAADVPLTERDCIENYAKKYDIPIEEFYPDSLVHG